ncbi:MAG: hypothetical protein WCD44_01410 [Candidatus Babeliales bacterium]|jgi:hypothetical protein
MPRMLDNCFYDKVKLLHNLSCTSWFIDKHAKEDAKKAGDDKLIALLEKLEQDLHKYVDSLKKMISQ